MSLISALADAITKVSNDLYIGWREFAKENQSYNINFGFNRFCVRFFIHSHKIKIIRFKGTKVLLSKNKHTHL